MNAQLKRKIERKITKKMPFEKHVAFERHSLKCIENEWNVYKNHQQPLVQNENSIN